MNAVAAPKSSAQNRLEGFALSAVFQGLPTFASAVLILKVMGAREIVTERGGAAIFVAIASIIYALIAPKLAAWFPRMQNGHEPLFYDASLSVSDKIAQWRSRPRVSLQLMTTVIMMSLLAVVAASLG
ncbi:hypothetical protein IC762_29285 [Bradyrhizobium genosp. L]|uniref:hypothetical protein n=1 Tax=Bradyrhizobium genosp. L TaxID=83637 RepID=UPI0018A27BF4|nr:hypothetical protein [Bradyrhizobium genosp. L]QPF83752.1 hypothetical protein IC762_29285 [Bradyrhizobium genosp. L]